MQNKKIVVVAAGSQACAPGLRKKVRVRGRSSRDGLWTRYEPEERRLYV